MRTNTWPIVMFSSLALSLQGFHCSSNPHPSALTLEATNSASIRRTEALVRVPIDPLLAQQPDLDPELGVVFDGGQELPTQALDSDGDGAIDEIAFLASFGPNEKRTFLFKKPGPGDVPTPMTKRTQAMLAVKKDFEMVDGLYTGGRFVSVKAASIPAGHFAHDAYFKFEGPGWESDKIAYRLYLDSRNRIDIFGKKVAAMVLQDVGSNDLVSDHRESYTRESDWGLDMFRVGESFGVGSFALWDAATPIFVSDVEHVDCRITADGNIVSAVTLTYRGWKVGRSTHTLVADLSIAAGSRLTRVDLTLQDEPAVWSTGLAKNPAAEYLSDAGVPGRAWGYIALFGAQSLIGDTLGIAVFYDPRDFVTMAEDSLSRIVVLRATGKTLTYYFAGAWGKEPGGITTAEEFQSYLTSTATGLGSPVLADVITGTQ